MILRIPPRHCRRALLSATLLLAVCAPPLAWAQYIWIDDKGVKQLSDRPPPPSVPDKRILKAPGKPLFNPYAPAPEEQPVAQAAAAAPAAGPPTLAERNGDFNKRKADAEAAAKRAAAEAQQKADQAANCNAARKNQMALDQGLRMSNFDKNGEQSFLSDAEKTDLAKKNEKVLSGCK